jgi:hypothetical protein
MSNLALLSLAFNDKGHEQVEIEMGLKIVAEDRLDLSLSCKSS